MGINCKNGDRKDLALPAIIPTLELERMLSMAAELVCHDSTYVPIFLRIEKELTARQVANDVIGRARAICILQKAKA